MEFLNSTLMDQYPTGLENTLWEVISDKDSSSNSEISMGPPSVDSGNNLGIDDNLFDILFTPPDAPVKTEPKSQVLTCSDPQPQQQQQVVFNRILKKPKQKRILTSTASSTVIKIEPEELLDYYQHEQSISSQPVSITSPKPASPCIITQAMDNASHSKDMKIFKRQQRMIRNRESASLSRQRRKAHLEGIETRNNKLETENKQLKHSNLQLQQQLNYLQRELSQLRPLVATFTQSN